MMQYLLRYKMAAYLCLSLSLPAPAWTVDGELKIFFLLELTNEAFEPPNHKTHFGFTLGYPWNVQIQFLEFDEKKI